MRRISHAKFVKQQLQYNINDEETIAYAWKALP